jgi:hypothetical protein
MNQRLLRALCIVPVCVLWGCVSPPTKVARSDVAKAELTVRQKEAFAGIFAAYRGVLLTNKQTCTSDCTVTIKLEMVKVVLDDKKEKEFCVGTLPETLEFMNTAPGNSEKTITWVLDKTLVPNEDVEFHEKYGILKIGELPNGNGQFNPDNQRTDKVTYKGKNKHKVRDTQATYVPLIIRFVNGLPEVCGTADPRIINL